MVVLTTDSSPGGGQSVPWVLWPCSSSSLITLHIGAPEARLWCSSSSLLLHAFASLGANRCCLESRITGAGISADYLISARCRVVGGAPRMDLDCRLRRKWRSSRLPTSLGSHQSSLPHSATALTHATWTALTLSGTTPYVLVRVWSQASAALAFFMVRLRRPLNVRCVPILTPSHRVACVLNRMMPLPTVIFADSFGRKCILWPRLRLNRAASVIEVSNCSPCVFAHSMLFAVHISSFETTWLTSLLVATQPWSSTQHSPSASDTYYSTHFISPEV